MVEFVTLTEIEDSVRVNDADVSYANTYVENFLKNIGVDPSVLTEIPGILKELAKLVALERACIRLSQTEESVYLEKAKAYGEFRKELEEKITPRVLGVGESVFVAKLGRA